MTAEFDRVPLFHFKLWSNHYSSKNTIWKQKPINLQESTETHSQKSRYLITESRCDNKILAECSEHIPGNFSCMTGYCVAPTDNQFE